MNVAGESILTQGTFVLDGIDVAMYYYLSIHCIQEWVKYMYDLKEKEQKEGESSSGRLYVLSNINLLNCVAKCTNKNCEGNYISNES